MKKYSLVLEGGGAKGAYQVGAIKALQKRGLEIDCIIGTSIGAINAAFIAQRDIDKLEKLWQTLSFQDLMDINNELVENIFCMNFTSEILNEARKKFIKAFKEKGIDTANIRHLLEMYIDEEKIRNSSIRFGLVTYCLSNMKPQKLFIEDIPKGKLVDYLMATSNLPVFKRQKIDNMSFLDGGAYDNCSVEMLYDAGYKNIIAIKLFKKRNRIRNYSKLKSKKDLNLNIIVPSEELPFILNFETKTLNKLLKYGYIDTIKQIDKLDGYKYAIYKIEDEKIDRIKDIFTPAFSLEFVKYAKSSYKIGDNIINIALEKSLKKLCVFLCGINTKSFKKQVVCLIEYVANKGNVSKNKIYTLDELIHKAWKVASKNIEKSKGIEKAAYYFIENIKEDE